MKTSITNDLKHKKITMPNEFWTVLEEVQRKRQEADEKAHQFLAGREVTDLIDEGKDG